MPEAEIIDQTVFATFFDSLGGDMDFLNEMVETYLCSSADVFAKMHQAIDSGQAPVLQREAHSLKSGSASFGALAFSAQCKELEDIGRSGILDHAADKLRDLEKNYIRVVAALHDQVQRVKS
jgi:HPt (histidine-containing phosphotransfer) domain-containing protein